MRLRRRRDDRSLPTETGVNWCEELRSGVKSVLWRDFQPVSDGELDALERTLGRALPADFREFMRTIGCGYMPPGGEIDSPEQIDRAVGTPIYYVTGSMTPGREWATAAEHRELWLSKGVRNPNPGKFTQELFEFNGMNLLDFHQIGSDGSTGYQMLNLDEASPTKYLLINESTRILFAGESFRAGILWLTDWLIGDD